jgi:hypothetical protein
MKAITASVVMTMMTAAALGGAEPQADLTIRLYNASGLPNAAMLAVRHAVESILRDTGLSVVFRQCGTALTSDQPVDACDEPLKRSELVVRVIDAPAFSSTLHPDAYGPAYVVPETNRGWLATVFSDRVTQAASRLRVDPGTLMGLVAAHEVGHLLLGSGYHGAGGLVRADWPDALLTRETQEWRFSTHEAERIHRVLESIVGGTHADES